MKKFQNLLMVMLMALVSVGFASCGDDEPEGADIVGTWQYNHPADEEGPDYDLFYQFTKDGVVHRVVIYHEKYIGKRNIFVDHGTYAVSGKTLNITFNPEVESTGCEYSVQGNRLMFLDGDEPTFTRVEDSVIQPYL